MDTQLILKFLDSLIDKTRKQEMTWDRLFTDVQLPLAYPQYDPKKSLFYEDDKAFIIIGIFENDGIDLIVKIIAPKEMPINMFDFFEKEEKLDEIDSYYSKLYRLYDLASSDFNTLEKYIKSFI